MKRPRPAAGAPKPTAPAPDPDQAWKALSLVNDWVKHAESKLGVLLAVTGVSGGVLFNLVKDASNTSLIYNVAAVVCASALFVSGGCAMVGLFPRVKLKRKTDDTVNPLFFHDVARAYRGDAPSYSAVLHTLTTNLDDLVRHLSHQVHANATVAQRKYRWADRGIRALQLALVALAALVTIIALKE